MNRRQFTQALAAFAAAPAVPVRAFSAPLMAMEPVTYGIDPALWTRLAAKVNVPLSLQVLQLQLGLTSSEAQKVFFEHSAQKLASNMQNDGMFDGPQRATSEHLNTAGDYIIGDTENSEEDQPEAIE